jgi:transcriptional regulator with XRE-family HTH domain
MAKQAQAGREQRVAARILVRELRKHLGLTQEQFAQKVGVTYSTVNHWENGKRSPQPFLLRRLHEMKHELDASGQCRGGEGRE